MLGCAQECMFCCCKGKTCCAVGHAPLPCCCCGPTCGCNATVFKVEGTILCCSVKGSFPCSSETPILITPLPFCTLYPKRGCCHTLDSLGAKTSKNNNEPTLTTMDRT